jgi:peptidoglycan hydrolase-like protein with peptidoglycan-binding domain
VLAGGCVAGWAGSAVFAPPNDVLEVAKYTYVELAEGEVGSKLHLNAAAAWPQSPAGSNQVAGTVTSVAVAPGDEVGPGSVLYSVNLRPVVIAAGATPAFRSLARESEGADVAQLQNLLVALGYYSGEADGEFGWRTEEAVQDWQESLGLPRDGVVQTGDLVFVPSLPTRVSLDPAVIFRGATVSGGEDAIAALSSEPVFSIPATATQATMMPIGTRVELNSPAGVWAAQVAEHQMSEENPDQVNVTLQGIDAATICGDQCGSLPTIGKSLIPATIVTQEAVVGVVAPSAALVSAADGVVSVIDDEGLRHTVTVVASARGMSVIGGAPAGLRVRVPGSEDNATGAAP